MCRRFRRRTSCWANTVRTRATTARRAGRHWKRSSVASKAAPRSPSLPAWRQSPQSSINFPRDRSWPYRTDCYQGVAGLAQAGQRRGRWTVHRVAVADTARWVELCGVADLIWLESPSNPLLTVGDLDTICARAAETWRDPGRGQHLCDAAQSASTDARGRRSRAIGDEVHRRTLGLARRRRHGARRQSAGGATAVQGAHGCNTRHARGVSRGARGENAGTATGAGAAHRDDTGRAPRAPSQRHADALSGLGEPSDS
jgi:hypothetical protein